MREGDVGQGEERNELGSDADRKARDGRMVKNVEAKRTNRDIGLSFCMVTIVQVGCYSGYQHLLRDRF